MEITSDKVLKSMKLAKIEEAIGMINAISQMYWRDDEYNHAAPHLKAAKEHLENLK